MINTVSGDGESRWYPMYLDEEHMEQFRDNPYMYAVVDDEHGGLFAYVSTIEYAGALTDVLMLAAEIVNHKTRDNRSYDVLAAVDELGEALARLTPGG